MNLLKTELFNGDHIMNVWSLSFRDVGRTLVSLNTIENILMMTLKLQQL